MKYRRHKRFYNLLLFIYRSDFMGKQGIRFVRRGPKRSTRVGFYYFEIILALLRKHPEGLRATHISNKARIPYTTVLSSLRKMEEMNRIQWVKLKVYNGPPVKHYRTTEWELK